MTEQTIVRYCSLGITYYVAQGHMLDSDGQSTVYHIPPHPPHDSEYLRRCLGCLVLHQTVWEKDSSKQQ